MSDIDFVGVDRSFVGDVEVSALFAGANPMWMSPTTLVANGGTITDIIVDGYSYTLHTFTANGTFTIDSGEGVVEVLLVAGGGSGGSGKGGGGGGGGVIQGISLGQLRAGTYAITVGLGGTANTNQKGTTGGNSVAFGLTAYGGGGGGYQSAGGAKTGGCNGGNGAQGGSITIGGAQDAQPYKGQGYIGGQAQYHTTTASRGGGGGGGAGGVGGVGSIAQGGAGGPGLQLGFTGANVYYSAGGAGGATTDGAGGTGGGGVGSTPPSGVGAGSGGTNSNATASQAGANGAVYIRYRKADHNKYDLKAVLKFGNDANTVLSNTHINVLANEYIDSDFIFLKNIHTGANTGFLYFASTDGPNDNSTTGSGVNEAGQAMPDANYNGTLMCTEITTDSWYAYYPYTISHSLQGLKPLQKYLVRVIGTRSATTETRITQLTVTVGSGANISYDISQYPRTYEAIWTTDIEGRLYWDQINQDGATYSYLAGLELWEVEKYESFNGEYRRAYMTGNTWLEFPDGAITSENMTIAFRARLNSVETNVTLFPGLKFFFSHGSQRLFANFYTSSFSSLIQQVSHPFSNGVTDAYNETTVAGKSFLEGDTVSVMVALSANNEITGGRTATVWVNGEQILGASYPNPPGNYYIDGGGSSGSLFLTDVVTGGANTASVWLQTVWFSRELVDPYLHWDKFFNEDGLWILDATDGTVANVTPLVYQHGNETAWNSELDVNSEPYILHGDPVAAVL